MLRQKKEGSWVQGQEGIEGGRVVPVRNQISVGTEETGVRGSRPLKPWGGDRGGFGVGPSLGGRDKRNLRGGVTNEGASWGAGGGGFGVGRKKTGGRV